MSAGAFAGVVPPTFAAVVVGVVLVVALVLERRRPATAGRRGLRAVALVVAAAAAWALATDPFGPRGLGSGETVLLTPGAPAGTVPTSGPRVIAVGGGPAPAGAERVPDAAAVGRRHPGLERVAIVGHGLAPWEWEALPNVAVDAFVPPPLPSGIADARWPRRLALGEPFVVAGTVIAPAEARLRLVGPGGEEGALELGERRQPFSFTAVPRAAGRHLYRLELAGPEGVLAREELGVEVVAGTPPRVLWIEDAPSLETREVKRWLAESDGPFELRSRLSAGRWRTERRGVEASASPPGRALRADDLAQVDLLVLEGEAWREVAAEELDRAVRDGLGVLLLPDEGAAAPTLTALKLPVRAVASDGDLPVRLAGEPWREAPPLVVAAREIDPEAGLRPLLVDRGGRVLAASRPWDGGRVGLSVLAGTWRWVRLGEETAHRAVWSELFRALARPDGAARWTLPGEPSRSGLPATVALWSADEPPEAFTIAPSGERWPLALRQDPAIPERYEATFWPREAGWHRLVAGSAEASLHVAPAAAWRSREAALRQEATAAREAAAGRAVAATSPPSWRLLALLAFVGALGLLWAEERLGASRRSAPTI